MNSDLLELDLPVFDRPSFPPPVLTLEQWLDWVDEVRRYTPKAQLNQWIHDERNRPVDEPFVME